MDITAEHLHHMAKRHHATMQKLDGITAKIGHVTGRFVGTIETASGAWFGGAIEGRTGGLSLGPIPINLGVGALLLVGANMPKVSGKWGEDLNNLGNGFVGSWAAATGYAFGKRWRETGKLMGGHEGHPWTHPYDLAPPAP